MFPPRLALLAFALTVPCVAHAQAWSYPSFQPPRLTIREFNFGLADAGGPGTSLLFQWREQAGPRHQFSFDVGIADPDHTNTDVVLFGGVQAAWMLGAATPDVPLDFLLTAGLFAAVGSDTRIRLPVGLSVGHRFELEGNMAVTPYAHPRLSIDLCNRCGGESNLGVSFDLGASLELSRILSVRASGLFTGTRSFDDEGFGVSIAWTPPSLARLNRRPGG